MTWPTSSQFFQTAFNISCGSHLMEFLTAFMYPLNLQWHYLPGPFFDSMAIWSFFHDCVQLAKFPYFINLQRHYLPPIHGLSSCFYRMWFSLIFSLAQQQDQHFDCGLVDMVLHDGWSFQVVLFYQFINLQGNYLPLPSSFCMAFFLSNFIMNVFFLRYSTEPQRTIYSLLFFLNCKSFSTFFSRLWSKLMLTMDCSIAFCFEV